MKKIIVSTMVVLILVLFCTSSVFAVSNIIDPGTTSKMVELSQEQKESLEDYKKSYGDDTYGLVAYILNKIRLFSIPFCFLGIAISAIYQYVIGIRKLDVRYKGFYTMIAFVTLFVIAQVLPLVFVIVIKGFGRS